MKRERTAEEKVIRSLEDQIKEANRLLITYNNFIKEEFNFARILGTEIDKYIIKYHVDTKKVTND